MEATSEIMTKESFKVHKWNSNNSEVKRHFQSNGLGRPISQKILGVNRYTVSDTITVDLKNFIEEKCLDQQNEMYNK